MDRTGDRPFGYNPIRSFSLRAESGGSSVKFDVSLPSTGKIGEDANCAREELEHFEQVNQRLEERGIALGPLAAPPYGAGLAGQIRKQEPERLLDSLLVSSLIEARSHERLGLLGYRCPDAELAKFYRSLMAKASAPLWGILDFGNNLFRSRSCD